MDSITLSPLKLCAPNHVRLRCCGCRRTVRPSRETPSVNLNRDTVLNANTIPQMDVQPYGPVRVRALLFWRVAGEQWITGTNVATSLRLVLVEPDEPIDRDCPIWPGPEDTLGLEGEPHRGDRGDWPCPHSCCSSPHLPKVRPVSLSVRPPHQRAGAVFCRVRRDVASERSASSRAWGDRAPSSSVVHVFEHHAEG